MKQFKTFSITFLIALAIMVTANCNPPKDKNDMGTVDVLPKGSYTIWNSGSRHLVKCIKDDGRIYWLSDMDFEKNGIKGTDAHDYVNKTQITVK